MPTRQTIDDSQNATPKIAPDRIPSSERDAHEA